MAIGGVLLLSQRPWADWFQTRTDIAGAAVIGGVILAGILAAVLAIKPIAQPEIGVENLA